MTDIAVEVLATLAICTPTTGAQSKIVDLCDASNLHGATNLQAPRWIWQGSEARLPRKVFNRTYHHPAQETEI
jgi:hypothetical protein